MNSQGGIGDFAIVKVEGYEEMEAERNEKKQAVIDACPDCEFCGVKMVPVEKEWEEGEERPKIKCPNAKCKCRHRSERGKPNVRKSGEW
jgi:hypothetical protein